MVPGRQQHLIVLLWLYCSLTFIDCRKPYSSKVSIRVGDIFDSQETPSDRDVYRGRFLRGSNSNMQLSESLQANPTSKPSPAADTDWKQDKFKRIDKIVMGQRVEEQQLIDLRPNKNPNAIKKLRRLLGKDLELDWMSIKQPQSEHPPAGYPKIDPAIEKALKNMDFNEGMDFRLTGNDTAKIKRWLLNYSQCPMKFRWENLGPSFWPPYVRRGVCESAKPCSWPKGMRCRLSGSKTLKLLRWKCEQQNPNEFYKQRNKNWFYKNRVARQAYQRRRRKRQHVLMPGNQVNKRRAQRRIRRQLAVYKNGYHCQWTRHDYLISDHCSCNCG